MVGNCGCGGNCSCTNCQAAAQGGGVSGINDGLTVSPSGLLLWGALGGVAGYFLGDGKPEYIIGGVAVGAGTNLLLDNV